MSWIAHTIGYWTRSALNLSHETETTPSAGSRIEGCLEACLQNLQMDSVPDVVVLSSTILSPSLWQGAPELKQLEQRLKSMTGCDTVLTCTGFRCVSWAHALAHVAEHMPAKSVLLLIVDLELDELNWLTSDRSWGKSGEGILAVGLENNAHNLPNGTILQTAESRNAVLEFGNFVKRHAEGLKAKVCGPFFPDAVARTYDLLVHHDTKSAYYHALYGHCFGADPWIALAHESAGSTTRKAPFLLASMAIHRYVGVVPILQSDPVSLCNFDPGNERFY